MTLTGNFGLNSDFCFLLELQAEGAVSGGRPHPASPLTHRLERISHGLERRVKKKAQHIVVFISVHSVEFSKCRRRTKLDEPRPLLQRRKGQDVLNKYLFWRTNVQSPL